MALTTSPLALIAMDQSGDPLQRVLAAGERLSNLAWHFGHNTREPLQDHHRAEFRRTQEQWDDAVRELMQRLSR